MIGSFKFNGVESDSFGLICKSVKRPLLPAVKVRRIEPVGFSGAYDFDENVEYGLRTITMQIVYLGASFEELRTRARAIAAWLSCPTWAKLTIHDEEDKYYLAKVTDEIDLDSVLEAGAAEITFDCQPFAYAKYDTTIPIGAFGFGAVDYDFTNPGTRLIDYRCPIGSKFTIQLTGSWNTLSLQMNGLTLTYSSPGTGELLIDNVEMTATLDNANVFSKLGGNIDTFLNIFPGENSLVIDGTSLSVGGTIRFTPLWM